MAASTQLFILFGVVLALMIWGRFRHDLVAAGGLFAAFALGIISEERIFSGFSHPAVLIVALVSIVSKAFQNSGALALITRSLVSNDQSTGRHILVTGGIGAAMSAFMNNVAALAFLMPFDVQAAQRARRPPSATLMPLAFATILGGMVTLIGTPPNIIVSGIRQQTLGAPFQMFDFSPVGSCVALAGLVFIAVLGWKLVPGRRDELLKDSIVNEFVAELDVPEESTAVGKRIAELDDEAQKADVIVLGLVQAGKKRVPGRARFYKVSVGDVLVIEGSTEGVASFIKNLKLQPKSRAKDEDLPLWIAPASGDERSDADDTPDVSIVEAVVRNNSPIVYRTAESLKLRSRYGVTLLGIGHGARRIRTKLKSHIIEAGDLLLISGNRDNVHQALESLDLIELGEQSVARVKPWRVSLVLGLFMLAVIGASVGVVSFTTGLAMTVAAYGATGLIKAREVYTEVDWPIVVMLACLLPLGVAMQDSGGSALIAKRLVSLTSGQSPVVTLVVLMVVTMSLSDVLNNVATVVIAAPVALAAADKLGVNPDTYLMGVAVAASCAFLTPIGHQNNMLIMGPGGYRFADYWRLGLPLEVVVLLVGVPMLLVFWPL